MILVKRAEKLCETYIEHLDQFNRDWEVTITLRFKENIIILETKWNIINVVNHVRGDTGVQIYQILIPYYICPFSHLPISSPFPKLTIDLYVYFQRPTKRNVVPIKIKCRSLISFWWVKVYPEVLNITLLFFGIFT